MNNSKLEALWPPIVFGVGFLAIWELGVRIFDIQQFLLPAPTGILSALAEQWNLETTGGISGLRESAFETGQVALVGLICGVLVGGLLALATARFQLLRDGVTPLAVAANATPIVALAPIFNVWFGINGMVGNVAVVVVVVFFPVFINTAKGLSEVPPAQLELMRSYAAPESSILRQVRIPNALPFFTTSLRIAAPLAVIATIVAEYFGGPRNRLGPFITQNAAFSRYDNAWAAIVMASILGLFLFGAAVAIERLLTPNKRPVDVI